MRVEKHLEIIKEVIDEIESAMNDLRGLKTHQRRLVFMLSIGSCELIEVYLHKLGVIKDGSRIKHEWFKQKRIKSIIAQQLICSIDSIDNVERIIELAKSIEDARENMAYGSPFDDEKLNNGEDKPVF